MYCCIEADNVGLAQRKAIMIASFDVCASNREEIPVDLRAKHKWLQCFLLIWLRSKLVKIDDSLLLSSFKVHRGHD